MYREGQILRLLDHPNVIRLFEIMETKKDIILVIEYAAGGELLNYIIAHGRVKEPEAKKFVRQIVDALVITDYDQGLMCIELLSFNARGTSRFKS